MSNDLLTRALDEAAHAAGGDGQPRPLSGLRAVAAEHLARLGPPTRRLETWKYTDIRPILARAYRFERAAGRAVATPADVERARITGLNAPALVFVNGSFAAELSDRSEVPGLTAGSLLAALHAGDVPHFARLTRVDEAAFVALNQAFELDGPLIQVEAGVALDRPVQIIHLLTAEAETFVQSRALIVVEAGAQAGVVETFARIEGDAPVFSNVVTEVVVGEDATLEYHRIQNEGDAASQVSSTYAEQSARSNLRTGAWMFSGELIRNDLNVTLAGGNAETNLAGLYVLHGKRHVDNRTLLDHAAPGCMSDELYRGIVFDRGVGVFNGKVLVRREGQQTNAYQQSQGVVLSDEGKHFSKPELEIYADDVKCSHGSTTGEVDPEAMFYLRSRGIAFDRARALLLTAFAHDVVERVRIEGVRSHLDRLVDAALS